MVSALRGEGAVTLHVEPWGETFEVLEGTWVVVTLLGKLDEGGPGQVEVSRTRGGIIVGAGPGCSDYAVTKPDGEMLSGR